MRWRLEICAENCGTCRFVTNKKSSRFTKRTLLAIEERLPLAFSLAEDLVAVDVEVARVAEAVTNGLSIIGGIVVAVDANVQSGVILALGGVVMYPEYTTAVESSVLNHDIVHIVAGVEGTDSNVRCGEVAIAYVKSCRTPVVKVSNEVHVRAAYRGSYVIKSKFAAVSNVEDGTDL